MTTKLKIAGAWSGVLEAQLDDWTIPFLKQQIANRLDCSTDSINLITAGKVLRDDSGTQKLIELGLKNNSKILVTRVSPDQGKELVAEEEKSTRLQRLKFGFVRIRLKILVLGVDNYGFVHFDHLFVVNVDRGFVGIRLKILILGVNGYVHFDHLFVVNVDRGFVRIRAAATSLAKRHADGSLPVEDFNLELENQSGEKVKLGTEDDQRALMMGLMFHGKAKRLVKSKKYEDALEVLTMGELIDNVPILQIDMVWCYFMLKDISKLSVAGKRLEEARKGIERSHGKESTRLRLLMGTLILNLHCIVAYHSGDLEKAKRSLNSARLQVPDEELSMLMGMGYGERAAKRALRMNRQSVERAVDFSR
ncbi:putative Ubiquitin-like domain, UBA-like superfamily, Ubiquitin-associated domain-containing protein [Helianthus annuus]|nr:putative Ubiquitin-like domain, UBA-like superfamily, Ubiquitin-associated domain-containing protein [Helianthus annuus]